MGAIDCSKRDPNFHCRADVSNNVQPISQAVPHSEALPMLEVLRLQWIWQHHDSSHNAKCNRLGIRIVHHADCGEYAVHRVVDRQFRLF